MGFLIFLIIVALYLWGFARVYVKVRTTHKEWADRQRKNYNDPAIGAAQAGSWITLLIWSFKASLDKKVEKENMKS